MRPSLFHLPSVGKRSEIEQGASRPATRRRALRSPRRGELLVPDPEPGAVVVGITRAIIADSDRTACSPCAVVPFEDVERSRPAFVAEVVAVLQGDRVVA